MTGQRRANWEAKLAEEVASSEDRLSREMVPMYERLERAEIKLRLQAVALILLGLGGILMAVRHG